MENAMRCFDSPQRQRRLVLLVLLVFCCIERPNIADFFDGVFDGFHGTNLSIPQA